MSTKHKQIIKELEELNTKTQEILNQDETISKASDLTIEERMKQRMGNTFVALNMINKQLKTVTQYLHEEIIKHSPVVELSQGRMGPEYYVNLTTKGY